MNIDAFVNAMSSTSNDWAKANRRLRQPICTKVLSSAGAYPLLAIWGPWAEFVRNEAC